MSSVDTTIRDILAKPSMLSRTRTLLGLLWNDKPAAVSALFVVALTLTIWLGGYFLADASAAINLRARNLPPFGLDQGWLYFLGADKLGRSMVARLIVAGQFTLYIALTAVLISFVVGTTLGIIAGYFGGRLGTVILRGADVIMSFPLLLLALIVLFVLSPSVSNLILVLAISRTPLYLRTARAEVMSAKERTFVVASRLMGTGPGMIILRHILPSILPTLITVATLDLSFVMLTESSLSFLGLGVQSPGVTWGLMVADGRGYLASAWWLSFWPGLAISLTAIAANLLANWSRVLNDPLQRWRLESKG